MPAMLRRIVAEEQPALQVWRTVLALLLVAITWLATTPAPPPAAGLLWDKLNHLAAFFCLAAAASLGFRRRWLAIAVGLLAYGGLIEVLQSLTPSRTGDWVDLLADAAGIGLGQAAAALALRWAVRARR